MKISEVLQLFKSISLSGMDKVKLMNRTDRKYWFSKDLLPGLLESVKDDYYVLELDGKRSLPYVSTYYDTTENRMYYEHHRGKLNRFKIRKRRYESSGISFLEIKFKNNKGRTIKTRIPAEYDAKNFDETEHSFIAENSPFDTSDLNCAIKNAFDRITLVSKNMNERCTIDQNLSYYKNRRSIKLKKLIIVEVKTEGNSHSVMIDRLNELRIRPSGFSKYCIGRSIIEPELKSNRFKIIHRQMEKKINITINQETTTA